MLQLWVEGFNSVFWTWSNHCMTDLISASSHKKLGFMRREELSVLSDGRNRTTRFWFDLKKDCRSNSTDGPNHKAATLMTSSHVQFHNGSLIPTMDPSEVECWRKCRAIIWAFMQPVAVESNQSTEVIVNQGQKLLPLHLLQLHLDRSDQVSLCGHGTGRSCSPHTHGQKLTFLMDVEYQTRLK